MRKWITPSGSALGLVLYVTKGLAEVAAAEVTALVPGAQVRLREDRFLILDASPAGAERLGAAIRTVDDIRLLVAGPARIGGRAGFEDLCQAAAATTVAALLPLPDARPAALPLPDAGPAALPLPDAGPAALSLPDAHPAALPLPDAHPVASPAAAAGAAGVLGADPALAKTQRSPQDQWSVTMSARNPPWRREPAWDPAPVIAAHLHGADPAAIVRRPVDLRIQVDEDVAHIAVSLWPSPVGKRPGEPQADWAGGLRPTVAAALVRLGLAAAGPAAAAGGLYDPFCGGGTIVAEAARAGLRVFGSDVSEQAVTLTRGRLAAQGGFGPGELARRVFVHDVQRAPDPRVTARLLVGNMPWGKQVKVERRLALFDATALLAAHTAARGGAAVLLTTHEEQLLPRLRRRGLTATARRIGLPGQTPAIVTAQPS